MRSHQRVSALALTILVCSGCAGLIGGEPTGEGTPRGDGETPASTLPLRALTPYELQNTIGDVFGDKATEIGALQPASLRSYIETTGDTGIAWAGERGSGLEEALYRVATRMVSAGGRFADCAAAAGDSCLRESMQTALPLLWRRAVLPEDIDTIAKVLNDNIAAIGRKDAMARALQVAMMSADALYLTSIGDGKSKELTGAELAGRMSYVVWSSAPDKALLDEALAGKLSSKEGRELAARRLIADPKSARGISRFFTAWIGGLNLDMRVKDPSVWNAKLRADSLAETRAFVESWWTAASPPQWKSLLRSDSTFLTEDLAKHYGVAFPGGEGIQQVKLDAASRRHGLLSQASFLTSSTASTGSSPTLRGRWVLEHALCIAQGAPPADTVSNGPPKEAWMSTRDYHEKLQEAPGCKACHQSLEPSGYAFEVYDGVGRLRLREADKDVRNNTQMAIGKDIDGSYASEKEFFDALATSATVRSCVARHLLEYTMGRAASAEDASLREAVANGLANDAREALLQLLLSDSFRIIGTAK